MIQRISKRFLSLLLVAVMVLALVPAITLPAFAATSGTVTGLADENIGLSFTGDADDAWSANGTSIIGAATSTGGTCSDTPHESTLKITNKKSTTATLSFDYSIEQNSGKIQVDGTEVSSGASFTKELATNESVKVYIQSGSTSAATKITLTNVVLVSDVNATATFVPAENGTYTVNGTLITEEYSNTQSSMTAYQVVATPAEGYQFLGWYNLTTGKCIATAATTALNIESDCTVTAKFASKTAALFETGGQRFDDLGDAVSYAQANSQSKITLATDGSISGTYTIPAGITLLIPFDAAGTLYTDAPAAIRTTPASKAFRTLTMSEGTSITVNGAISLGGRYFAAGGGQQGRPVGDYGYIKMADNSSITVKNGGNLYAWGFISGSGSILAESGATVYEFYQIADFRGGSASSNMGNSVFPFSQYFVQNIEAPLTLNAGANEQVYSGVYAMSTTYTTTINFIGDTGMFKVESGSFTKDYDEKTDRLVFTVNGEAALNTLSLTLAGMDVNSESYVLPITNNITINIQSGNVTINQNTALLAGVEVNIAEGAGLTVANGKSIYFYDSDEWNSDNFVWGPCKFKSVAYAPGKAYNRSNNDLVDAKMDVNGSVTAIGAIYTTGSGADICSSNGTGNYILQGAPGTATTTYQYNANGNKAVTIPITPAKLHNADDTYTETAKIAAGTTIPYANGKWEIPVCDHQWDEGVITTEPGCVTDGVKTYTCTICKETKTEVIPATGHTEVIDEAVEATCTTPGKTDGKHCSVCHAVIVAQEVVPMKEHTAVTVPGKAATCTEAGLTDGEKCSVCGKELKAQETIKALGHSWDEGKVTTAPTYEKTGVKTYTCGICKATKTESIPQLVNSGSGSSGGGSNKTTTYPVNIVTKTEDNGTTSSSSKMASKGNMVTITVEPDRYYVVDEVIIRDSRGKQLPVKDNGDGTYTFEMPADKVMVEPTFSWVNPFVDVKNTAYYTSAVEWTLKRMITQGTTDITFTPNGSCTRAHIVTFLWRAAGSPEPESAVSFADVPAGSYYAKAVAWAVENGITLGTTDVTFSPNAACTRAQSVTFLYRASEASASGAPTFYDVAEDAYYAAAVKWATDNGITNGIGNGLFGSNNTCTRAQIVTFLWRSYMGK